MAAPMLIVCPRCLKPREVSPVQARKVARRPQTMCRACALDQAARGLMCRPVGSVKP